MLRDFKFLRRNTSKNEEVENVPVNPRDSLASQPSNDGSSRPPLNTIQDPTTKVKPEPEGSIRSRIDRTPTKPKSKLPDSTLPLKTPDKHGFQSKIRYGWSKNEATESDSRNGGTTNMTPRVSRGIGRATSSCYSESNSTQSTPTKSVVSKPPVSGYRNKFDGNGGMRGGNFSALYRGMPSSSSCGPVTVVNTVEVPHFDLKEDPSFWMDHNVQVLIRVRPLNDIEKNTNGFNRCLKQENSQSIAWIGQPETRFTFDHVACETVDQEMLFRMAGLPMVENCLSGYNSCMFAYGQTGSGKTHTMLGKIEDLEVKPSPHRGMTPRIFEFLFARIQAEEEIRRDEKLKYNCKCSFLEIYNEQITDLLDPSATNLLLREDVKKGVYVENLTEFEVQTVSDILKLLSQGSLNRKVAATNMNRESSRSHSVFTCVIESRWEKDSATNLRFARLNLVDLAGSERQKASGAEGERLKEAASINKSLSTLGPVSISVLFFLCLYHITVTGYDKHFTLNVIQDSLGGNSKTMIIANVSPSICCAIETLNTLKFAQRAKLIQNNAVVNEDSTGDVIALQNQIRLLKEELSALKHQNVSRSLSFGSAITATLQLEEIPDDNTSEMCQEQVDDLLVHESRGTVRMSTKQFNSLEAILAGALRREKMGETCIRKLEAEIEQLNRLVHQREEDTRSSKMMLRFREDKIHRMESLVRGSLPADSFLLEENKALSEEIQLLQAKVDKNPEVTRFALENIRLLDQLRRYQEFYEEGEKELLLEEISKLRDQLLQFLDGKSNHHSYASSNDRLQEAVRISKENNSLQSELKNTITELEECRHNLSSCLEENAKLSREINDLQTMLDSLKSSDYNQDDNSKTIKGSDQNGDTMEMNSVQTMTSLEKIMNLQLELDILKIILQEEKTSHAATEERANSLTRDLEMANGKLLMLNKQIKDATGELEEAKSVIEALESQQIFSINEMEDLKNSKSDLVKLLSEQKAEIVALKKKLSSTAFKDAAPLKKIEGEESTLQLKLKRMHESLENAKNMNIWYQTDRAFKASNEEEVEKICRQAEAETAEVIVCLQEELALLQQQVQDCQLKEVQAQNGTAFLETELNELQEKVCLLTEDNNQLLGRLEMKDAELKTLTEEWELLSSEIKNILADGHEELADAGNQPELLSGSFPQRRIWISEKVGRVVRVLSEKELLIEESEDLQEKLCMLTEDNNQLLGRLELKDAELRMLTEEWELLSSEIENILADGHEELVDAGNQLELLSGSFPQRRIWISEKVGRVVRVLSEKELLIEELGRCLEDATDKRSELESMLKSLRGAALVINEAQQQECNEKEKEIVLLKKELDEKTSIITKLEDRMKIAEGDLRNASACATVAFVVVNRLSEANQNHPNALKGKEIQLAESAHALALEETMNDFEKLLEVKIGAVRQKINTVEQTMQEISTHWCQTKEFLELEVGDAKIVATQKASEASCILAKFEEAQDTITEADVMINGLMIANETMKLDIKRRKQVETTLLNERDELINEVKGLQSINTVKDQQLEVLEEQFGSSLTETRFLVAELEGLVTELQTAFSQSVMAVARDCHFLKSLMFDSMKLARSWLEDIWSEIIVKDCAVSVLHLCHMGVLLETLTGLNAENGLLQHGLSESNAVIADLKEHNSRSRRELEMCRVIKGKLLADIKNSFDRISKKEDETGELSVKLVTFEKKINDLQFQEEVMLQRSNNMGSQLAALMKELDLSNTNFVMSLLDQEQLLKDKEVHLDSQAEISIVDLCTKDFESLILASEMEQMVVHLAGSEKKLTNAYAVLDGLKQEIIFAKVDACLKEQLMVEQEGELSFLQENFEEAQIELRKFKKENCLLLQDLDDKKSDLQSSISCLDASNLELQQLKEKTSSMETCITSLQTDVELKANELKEHRHSQSILIDGLKLEIIFAKVDACLKEQLMVEQEGELSFLQENFEESQIDLRKFKKENCLLLQDLDEKKSDLQSTISCLDASNLEIQQLKEKTSSMETCITSLQTDVELKANELKEHRHSQSILLDGLEQEIIFAKVDACLKKQLMVEQEGELSFLQENFEEAQIELRKLKKENCLLLQDLDEKKSDLQSSISCLDASNLEIQQLKEKTSSMETCITSLQTDVELKANELKEHRHSQSILIDGLEQEIIFAKVDACLKEQLMVEQEGELSFVRENFEEAQVELRKFKKENCLLLQDLDEKKSDLQSSISCLDASNLEIQQLNEKTSSLETCITSLQTDLELKANELKELRHSQSILIEDLGSKTQDLHISIEKVNMLREENAAKCVDSMETIDMTGSRLFGELNKGVTIADKMVQELCDNAERISKFIEDIVFLENRAEELASENISLCAELSRKDEVLKGLLFDLSLLQESASNTKDQKDEIEEMVSSLEALEDELAGKSSELDEAVSHGHMLEVQLQEKLETIARLQLDITIERESSKCLYSENEELKSHIEDALAVKSSLEDELRERKKITKSLEVEISEMSNTLSQMNDTIEFLSGNLDELSGERDELQMEVLSLAEKLRKAQAEAKQSEAIAMEAQQMAESKKTYAEEKEAEVKLLERSVEELECTINVLENKVDIIKGEAERLQLQREELELELDAVKVQMQNVKNADADMKRCLDEKKKDLQQALDQIQILETEISDKDREIAQCKTHISELNLHAEAQAKEYTQKFKALESMVEQVKPEGYSTNAQSHSSNKLEKNVAKPRGSGSPFKCIGLGLAQQIKLEKDEDLTASRLRIEELESLAANRQKEIFSLNARLAAAESMTHDVIRDLLGVKLDMTNYVSLLDNQQVQRIAEKARLDSLESQVKDHEVDKLKQQLNEFVEERRGWLEEIDRKQAELVTAEVALEKLRQRDQLLKTENEMLKMENVNYKKKVMELEGEVKKLSGQQNLQQRIHHHAKIKEENNTLKSQNGELGAKLRRTEVVLSRVRDELAQYRASIGKSPYVNFDEEQRLNNKLRESDEDRVQLAHKLLGLCTSVLKAAGITMPISDVCPAAAEEALEQLQSKVVSLERELQSLTLKNKIYSERNRLSELMPQTSPTTSARTDENCHTPKRVPQAPFLSSLDR
ncbi:hypothetical protein V6N12_012061 [Hibiscus sabdariffa]|uniref:Kinesin motor domain-containing protein n=1 Tax=Hibiscus sabdariffa TaxID=183260 RepID=A0ABR2CH14_9ROSI